MCSAFFSVLLLFFWLCNNKISVAFFFACFNFAICIIFWSALCTIIYLFPCLFFFFFVSNMQSLTCLIFCNDFAPCFIHFCCKIVHFCIICFLQVLIGAASSFELSLCPLNLLLFAIRTSNSYQLLENNSFRAIFVFPHPFLVLISRVCILRFFQLLCIRLSPLFCFYFTPLFVCLPSGYSFMSNMHCAPLASTLYLPMTLSGHHQASLPTSCFWSP